MIASYALTMLSAVVLSRAAGTNTSADGAPLPPQSVFVDPHSFAVLGSNGTFRNSTGLFNPTAITAPFFQIFSKDFLPIIGPSPSIRLIAVDNSSAAFAFEAPIWVPATDEVFFASGDGNLNNNNHVSKISLKDPAISNGGLATVTRVPLAADIQTTNGGTPFRGNLLLANQGRGDLPPSLALVTPHPPYNSTILLDNFFGRQFNSLNDLKVHPTSGKIFFTDVSYGFLGGNRPPPQQPNQVYRFDPETGAVRIVADGFVQCNGIAFTDDGKTAFVTDTGSAGATGTDPTKPSTIYAFDVDANTQAFKNRRVFAFADTGIPDGIELDSEGNVYSGTGDGVEVWNIEGDLIGKFFIGHSTAQMIFAGKGRLVILAGTAIYLANIAAIGQDLQRF